MRVQSGSRLSAAILVPAFFATACLRHPMQILRVTVLSKGRQHGGVAISALLWILLSAGAVAQTDAVPVASLAAPVIPQQMRFVSTAPNRAGDTVEAVFRIYAVPQGGEPLWTETQQITIDANGKYGVLLGATTHAGLPQTLFAGGQARWLGVSIERAEELPRTPLSSVAYAMKAGDAETVGGIAAGRFVTQEQLAAMARTVAAQTVQTVIPNSNPSGTGTTNYIPIWTSSTNLGNSLLYQSGSNVGVGTTAPTSAFQVSKPYPAIAANGTNSLSELQVRQLALPLASGVTDSGYRAGAVINAYTTDANFLGTLNAQYGLIARVGDQPGAGAGTINNSYALYIDNMTGGSSTIKNSFGLYQNAAAARNYFAGKVGIGTKTPTANLEVNGTAKFDGPVTFAPAQTFPGTGTITGITTTGPLTGSGTSGSVALALDTSALKTTLNGVYAQLSAANTFTQGQTFNNGILSTENGTDASCCAVVGEGNGGATGVRGLSDSGIGILGASSSGVAGYFGSTSAGPTVTATNFANFDGKLADIPYAMFGNAPGTGITIGVGGSGNTGVYGKGSYYGVEGDGSTTGVYGSGPDGVDGYGTNNGVVGENTTNASYGMLGTTVNTYDTGVYGHATTYGVFGAGTTYGVVGEASGYIGVYGSGPTYGVYSAGPVGTSVYAAALAALPDNRVVEFYSVSSTENWFEDYGTGRLRNGAVTVALDPTYAQAVNPDAGYHVFLTPRGDCEGLYIAGETETGFEVRELHAGKSNIEFDYRIVARRRGFEGVRMEQLDADAESVEQIRDRVSNRPAQRTLTLRKPASVPKPLAAPPNPGIPPQPVAPRVIPRLPQLQRPPLLPARPNAGAGTNPVPKPPAKISEW